MQFILADAGQPVVQPRIVVLRPDDFDTTAYRRCRFADAVAFADLGASDHTRGRVGGDAINGIGAGGNAREQGEEGQSAHSMEASLL